MAEEEARNESPNGAVADDQQVAKKDQNSGRLELTWSNKDRALLAHEDGSYEWVPKRDYRVAEVRLLRESGTVGEVYSEEERAKDNLLIRGDSLNALTALARSPEFAEEVVGKVRLAYIDPPFNTGGAFEHYDDGLEHSVWLTMMRDRLMQIKELLASDGSIWVHIDDSEAAYCRVLLDEVFGRENFVASICWQKRRSREGRSAFSVSQDYILVYSPAGPVVWKDSRNTLAGNLDDYDNRDDDPRGPWKPIPMTAQGFRKNQMFVITAPNGKQHKPPRGGCWRNKEERFKELVDDDRIYWGKDGNAQPVRKRFLFEDTGLVPETLWLAESVGDNSKAKKELLAMFPDDEVFDTPKPEQLLERIIHIGSEPGDLVLDCFAGSGTTAAVAHKMGRRWITCEWDAETIDKFTAPRLNLVVDGSDEGGITNETALIALNDLPDGLEPEDAQKFTSLLNKFADHQAEEDDERGLGSGEVKCVKSYLMRLRKSARTKKRTETKWQGGGGFRVLDVAPSMYEDDGGVIVLADWATKSELAEAVSAQLSFEYEVDPPFCGRHGQVRLAVIDGHADEDAVRLLVKSLKKGEKLSLCATSLDPEAGSLLAKLRRGSQARVVPQDILLAYRTPSAWQVSVAREDAADDQPQEEGEATEKSSAEEQGAGK